MYRHIVLFWLANPSQENLIIARDKLRSLAGKIEGLVSVEVELDALRSERSCDLCLNMVFCSKEALDRYRTHPEHLPVQAHMHGVRSLSHAADYPITAPARRTPRLYASLGPSCANVTVLQRMFDCGMTGVRLNTARRGLAESAPWLDAFYSAATRSGVAPELIVQLKNGPEQCVLLPKDVYGVIQPPALENASFRARRAWLPERARIMAMITRSDEIAALPDALRYADEIVIGRHSMGRHAARHEIPRLQKRISAAANAAGKPFLIGSEILASMRDHPLPSAAELMDIHTAVVDGASGFILTRETSVGKYPLEAMETLSKTAEAALRG